MNLFLQVVFVFSALSILLVGLIDQNNEIIELRAQIPRLVKERSEAERELVKLQYEVMQQENPVHLMELLRKPECGHLHYPFADEVDRIVCD